ncbi:hypothetical protein [Propionivibrio limicola]|nr:hypothetical protein [Propionivibrio limicola]
MPFSTLNFPDQVGRRQTRAGNEVLISDLEQSGFVHELPRENFNGQSE